MKPSKDNKRIWIRTKNQLTEAEEKASRNMSEFIGVPLVKKRLKIVRKLQEFDLVNEEAEIVDDVKPHAFGDLSE